MQPSVKQKSNVFVRGSNAWKEGTPEESVKTTRDEVRRWINQITSAKKESEKWEEECKDAWREYQCETRKDNSYRAPVSWTSNAYSRYWSDTMVLLPAIYGECPRAIAKARFEQDAVARTGTIIAERLAAFLMEQSNFHRAMQKSALEYLHSSRATARPYVEAITTVRKQRVPLQEIEVENEDPEAPPTTALVDENYTPPPDDVPILTDEEGFPYYELDTEEEVSDSKFSFKSLHFDELVHSTGARDWDDIWWIAFKCTCTRKQAGERFGPIVKEIKSGADKDPEKLNEKKEDLFSYWELWDKRDRQVHWLHENYKEDYLDSQDDPYGLVDFFPCPRFMVVNERYNDVYPVPDFTQTRDQYEQLHLLARRINAVTKSIKGSIIYDGSVTGLAELFTEATDNQGVALADFGDLTSKGGLANVIQIPEYFRLAETLQTLIQVFTKTSEDTDQLRGISEVLRGTSDPSVSATAEKIKKAAANNRFSQRQKEMTRFVRDSLEALVDLALKVLEDHQIKEIVGFPYMDPEDQQRFDQALVVLRDDKSRLVRVDIETDALLAINAQEDKENSIELMDAFSKVAPALFQAVQQTPEMAAVGFKLMQVWLGNFRYGKNAEDELKQAFDQIYQKIQNPPPPPEPQPDPKLIKIQSDERIAMLEMQLKGQIEAASNQIDQMRLQIESFIAQSSAGLGQRKQNWQEQVDVQKMNLSAAETNLIISERMTEEARLSREQEIEVARLNKELNEPVQQPQVQAPQAPPVIINVQGGQPGEVVPIPIPQEPQVVAVPQPVPVPVNPLGGGIIG